MGKGGMGMVGANLSEAVGRKKHWNPKWQEGSEKPPPPNEAGGGPHVGEHIRKKHAEREHGSVDWASRFAEDERFGGAKVQWQAEQQQHQGASGVGAGVGGGMGMGMGMGMGIGMGMGAPPPPPPPGEPPSDEVPDFAALVEQARKIAEMAQKKNHHQQQADGDNDDDDDDDDDDTKQGSGGGGGMDRAEGRAKLLEADERWGAAVAPDGVKYYFDKTTGNTRWDAPPDGSEYDSLLMNYAPLVLGEPVMYPTLPQPWRELRDDGERRYYWNASEGITQWDRPVSAAIPVGTVLPVKRKKPDEKEEEEEEEEEIPPPPPGAPPPPPPPAVPPDVPPGSARVI